MPLSKKATKSQYEQEVARLEKELEELKAEPSKSKPLDISEVPGLEVWVYAAAELTEDRPSNEAHTFQVIKEADKTMFEIADISKKTSAFSGTQEFETQDLIDGIRTHHDRHFRQTTNPTGSSGVTVKRQPEVEIRNVVKGTKILLQPPTPEQIKAQQTMLQINNSQPLLFKEEALLGLARLLERKLIVAAAD